jgi:hypothetical protein
MEKRLAGAGADFVPQLRGAQDHRYIFRAFVQPEPQDAGGPVGASPRIGNGKLLDPEHAQPGLGEAETGGAAHATHAQNGDVEAFHDKRGARRA